VDAAGRAAGPDEGRRVIDVVAAVVERGDEVFVTRRPPGTHLSGLWEFPGGKVQPGESREAALAREIREELDVGIEVGALVFDATHAYDDRSVRLFFYACRLIGTPRAVLGQEMRWAARQALGDLSFPPADAELVRRLAAVR
jgi:8-oxo-dGTP diphosphatase